MFGPDAELYLTIPNRRFADYSIAEHDLSVSNGGIQQVHGRTTDELRCEQCAGRFINLQRGANLFSDTFIHHDHPVCHCHSFNLVMCHIKGRYPQFALQLPDFEAHLDTQLGIEIGQRFVKQEHSRLPHDSPSHCHTLTLPTGQLAWFAIQQIFQLKKLCSLNDLCLDLPLARPAIFSP